MIAIGADCGDALANELSHLLLTESQPSETSLAMPDGPLHAFGRSVRVGVDYAFGDPWGVWVRSQAVESNDADVR